MPFRGKPTDSAPINETPLVAVKALPERRHLELRFPNVEGYAFALRHNAIRCDVASMQPLQLEADQTPDATFVAPVVSASQNAISSAGTPFEWQPQTRDEFYRESRHLQTVKFWLAQAVVNRLTGTIDQPGKMPHQARVQLFPQVLRFVEQFVGTPNVRAGKVQFGAANPCDISLQKYFERIVERLCDAITPDESQGEAPLLPILNRFQPIGTTAEVHFVTQRPTRATQKSHIGAVVGDTLSWEQAAATQLELSPLVKSFARNDRLGLRIPYVYENIEHFYEPDFLVSLHDETMLLVEIKGFSQAKDDAKHEAAERWRNAVNAWTDAHKPEKIASFRRLLICREPQMLAQMLERHVT